MMRGLGGETRNSIMETLGLDAGCATSSEADLNQKKAIAGRLEALLRRAHENEKRATKSRQKHAPKVGTIFEEDEIKDEVDGGDDDA